MFRYIVTLVLSAVCVAFAQPGPTILWEHTYGEGSGGGIWTVERAPNGGYIFMGDITYGNTANRQLWVGQIDENGTMLWNRNYGGPYQEDIAFGGVAPLPNSNLMVLGTTQSYGAGREDIYLIKTNAVGESLWTRTYGGSSNDHAASIVACTDGGFAIGAWTSSYGAGSKDMYLMKVDSSGAVVWTHTFGGSSEDVCYSMSSVRDGGFLLVGWTYSFEDFSRNVYVVRTNPQGEPLWSRVIGGPRGDFGLAGTQTADDGFLIVGNGESGCPDHGNGYAIKLSAAGQTEWERFYCLTTTSSFYNAVQMPDGGYVLVGMYGDPPYHAWLYRVNERGEEIWSYLVSSSNCACDNVSQSLLLLPDGGLLVDVVRMYERNPHSGLLLRIAPEHHEPIHHFQAVAPTGLPYAIIVDSVRLDDGPVADGDEIGVFDGNVCVGAGITGQWPLSITAWQGDPDHNLPGFTVGHPMSFRFYERVNEAEVAAVPTYSTGDGTFGYAAFSRLSLTASLNANLLIPLRANFANLISLNIRPSAPNAATVFGDVGTLQAVYQDEGGVFIPPSINTIGEVHFTDAFRIYCFSPETLRVIGIPLNPQTEYVLDAGRWHWISYPLNYEAPVSALLAAIRNRVIIIKDDNGGAWIPQEDINTLGNLQPGKGYMVMVREQVTFRFNSSNAVQLPPPGEPWVNAPSVTPTGLPYHLVVKLGDGFRSNPPQSIEVLDGDLCVGMARGLSFSSQIVITVWQSAPQYHLDGFTQGHEIRVRLLGADGKEIPAQAAASAVFGAGAYAELNLGTSGFMPTTFTVGSVYPNPFNPTASLPITLSQPGTVELRVYDVLGRSVFSSRSWFTSGDHDLTLGRDQFGRGAGNGIYLIEVRYGDKIEVRKAALLK
jgi:hypothetical protein